jgi:hypothetical protein
MKTCMENHEMQMHSLNRGCGAVPSAVTSVLWRNLDEWSGQPEWTMARPVAFHTQHSATDYNDSWLCYHNSSKSWRTRPICLTIKFRWYKRRWEEFLSSVQHFLHCVWLTVARAMCMLSRALPYKLLTSTGGISTFKMCGWAGSNPEPWLQYQVRRLSPAHPTVKHKWYRRKWVGILSNNKN